MELSHRAQMSEGVSSLRRACGLNPAAGERSETGRRNGKPREIGKKARTTQAANALERVAQQKRVPVVWGRREKWVDEAGGSKKLVEQIGAIINNQCGSIKARLMRNAPFTAGVFQC